MACAFTPRVEEIDEQIRRGQATFRDGHVQMFAFPARKIEWPFVNVKVFGHGADLSPDSRQVTGEEGIDQLHHRLPFVGMTAVRGNVSSNLVRNKPMVYFSRLCGHDQANDRSRNEQATDGVMA